jgi:hypothetical protein
MIWLHVDWMEKDLIQKLQRRKIGLFVGFYGQKCGIMNVLTFDTPIAQVTRKITLDGVHKSQGGR